ncbi:MAG: hypothetical protein JO351_00600 [Candidatus Eremiobacteraeota bacterium]|nr:hypothetical protein [Candidatus Eremiobacteraeota bacterium]MBV9055122.1 hypothetical protein [Candidatus Eremiobacteraeota bacterium]
MARRRRVARIALLLALCACTRGGQPSSNAPTPTASPSPSPSPVPTIAVVTPAPRPAITGSAAPVAPRLHNKVPRLIPDAAPQILAVSMTETTVHPGDDVSGNVVTSSNVASVQARIGGYAVTLTKVGVGRFALTYHVSVPWFVRGNFAMRVVARNTRGDTVERSVPIQLR